ncbi:BatD family protein [Neptunomonas qingdaonensis]|uniref:Oxygen tolerance n=1 Tax=Neptunomonas qingdaonensis TaxID=1045558 RepID=A0A1I2PR62_9GAMM|nr:BatD family protein [Neptunomonas qingdaonensis]SFG18632.1 Oxygen tolerance [Neptunomonas qingdaonensis]
MRILLVFLMLIASAARADVNTYLNKYSISIHDTVRLTIESTQQGQPQRPDLSILTQDFDLLGNKKITISSFQGNTRQATTRWQVLLRPKKTGQLQIPAFSVNGKLSTPMVLLVTGQASTATTPSPPATPLMQPPVFIETTIDHTEAYAGSQLIYTVKLFHKEPLNKNAALSDPFINQALILPADDVKRSETLVKGQAYFLQERRYVIFPDEPGTHLIEPPLFSGTSLSDQYFETRGSEIEIAILPKANSNSQGYWLPLETLQLEESLDKSTPLEPGSSLIRTLTLTAHGLPAARLPSLSLLKNELADLELLKTELDESFDDQGLVSRRTETIKITVTERGEVTLPPIDIHWWDTYEDRSKIASLPPVILQVNAAPTRLEPPAIATSAKLQEINAPLVPDETTVPALLSAAAHKKESVTHIPLIVFLALVSIISSLGWLYSYHHLRKLKLASIMKRQTVTERLNEKKKQSHFLAEKNTFQALALACQQNNVDISRLRLIEWAQHFWPETFIENAEDISRLANNQTLDFLIIDLEQHLHSHEKSLWQGDLLLQAIETIRKRRLKGKA